MGAEDFFGCIECSCCLHVFRRGVPEVASLQRLEMTMPQRTQETLTSDGHQVNIREICIVQFCRSSNCA